MDFSTLAKLRKYLSVKHHLPGRLRLQFDKAILTDPEALEMTKSAPDMPAAVTKSSINMFSKSVLLEYDTGAIAPELLEAIIHAPDEESAAAALECLYSTLYME